MFSRSRHDGKAASSWLRIVARNLPMLIVGAALLSSGGRRIVAGLYRRHIRPLVADTGFAPDRASDDALPGTSDPSTAQVALTQTNEDAASDPGPPFTNGSDVLLSEPDSPARSAAIPVDRQSIREEQPPEQPHEQPHEQPREQPLNGGIEAGKADSVLADGSTSCPAEFPIKGNGRSGIYHLPSAFAYERTVPSICFRTPEAAERAGFRAARSRNP